MDDFHNIVIQKTSVTTAICIFMCTLCLTVVHLPTTTTQETTQDDIDMALIAGVVVAVVILIILIIIVIILIIRYFKSVYLLM